MQYLYMAYANLNPGLLVVTKLNYCKSRVDTCVSNTKTTTVFINSIYMTICNIYQV